MVVDKVELVQNIAISSILVIGGIASTFQALYPRMTYNRKEDPNLFPQTEIIVPKTAPFVLQDSK